MCILLERYRNFTSFVFANVELFTNSGTVGYHRLSYCGYVVFNYFVIKANYTNSAAIEFDIGKFSCT